MAFALCLNVYMLLFFRPVAFYKEKPDIFKIHNIRVDSYRKANFH